MSGSEWRGKGREGKEKGERSEGNVIDDGKGKVTQREREKGC